MTTERQPIPVLSAHPYPERTVRAPLLSPALSRRVAEFVFALSAFVLLIGLYSLLGAPGIHWPALWLVLPGAGGVWGSRWVLGEWVS